ncbi:MAG: hypothetical protein ACYSWX_10550 [Planctomycetota bacterium]|jgi:hypothetical protein
MYEKRCIWCLGRDGELESLEVGALAPMWRIGSITVGVHAEHRELAAGYFDRVEQQGGRVMVAVFGFALLPLLAMFASFAGLFPESAIFWTLPVTFLGLAVLVLRYPFLTPETILMFGVSRAKGIAKAVALLFVVLGVGLPLIELLG